MKSIYENILYSIYKSSSTVWFTGCHKHRVIPGYEGGEYVEGNVVFLSQREHSLVHWLRWKLFRDARDKRAFKMIGRGPSGLSHQDRIDHGKLCALERKGIHSPKFNKAAAVKKSIEVQYGDYNKTGKKNFYYWSTSEGRKERAVMGGKASSKVNQAFIDQMGAFKDRAHASRAASKSAKKPVHKDGIIRKFHTDEEVELFLRGFPDWKRGTGLAPTKGTKRGPSPRRRKVTDGIRVYESIEEASLSVNKTSATIINWCRSEKHTAWRYWDE